MLVWPSFKAGALLLALMLSGPGLAQSFDRATGPGRYGTPYAYVGPHLRHLWENYRKKDYRLTVGPIYPSVEATASPTDGRDFTYVGVRHGEFPAPLYEVASHGPGVWLGTAVSRQSPQAARMQVRGFTEDGVTRPLEVRAGFVQDGPDPSLGSVAAFVQCLGGDDGRRMDPHWAPWCANGLFVHIGLDPRNSHWELRNLGANLVGPTSIATEGGRTARNAEIVIEGVQAPADGGAWYVLPESSDGPVELNFELQQSPTGAQLVLQVGASARVTWLFDDGATRIGLRDPGNPDGLGYLNDAGLDVSQLVPMLMVGPAIYQNLRPLPSGTLSMRVAGATPVVAGALVQAAWPDAGAFEVLATFPDGGIDEGYAGTVQFSGGDAGLEFPPPLTFVPSDRGRATAWVRAPAPGRYTFELLDSASPEVRSTAVLDALAPADAGVIEDGGVDVAPHTWGVGCACDHTSPALLAWLAFVRFAAHRRPRREASSAPPHVLPKRLP